MAAPPDGRTWLGVDEFVEAYEAAQDLDGAADLAEFAPDAGHPDRLAILCELVRVDLEHQWGRGRPHRLEHYRGLFPALFDDPALVHAMASEEYRLRLQAGEEPTPEEYRRRFGLDRRDWPPPPGPPRTSATRARRLTPHASTAAEMERAASAYRAYRSRDARHPEALDRFLDSRGIPREHAELLRELDRTDPHAAERLAEAVGGFPKVGGSFLGFRLCGELGRGAFGRVYLARQGDMADRLVALKVSADVAGETHALAQLQHTNVVPVYSVHRRGPLQAVCMPYLGATTLADTVAALKSQATLPRTGEALLSSLRSGRPRNPSTAPGGSGSSTPGGAAEPVGRDPSAADPRVETPAATPQVQRLRRLSYVPAVLWLVARVADGLAHAHERGILHRDLKPANILFADDGEPLLLDFNLSTDVKVRLRASAALVGGTLPYMAPEGLSAFRDGVPNADPRGDVYAVGVILYELLTGTHPFPVRRGAIDDVLPAMIAERLGPVPDVRRANPSASPAVAAIVAHCLEPDPARRYQTARELQEDLHRQLDHLPLRYAPEPSWRERLAKWARRHPRLTSSTTVGLVSAALLAGLASSFLVRYRRYLAVEAAVSLRALAEERRDALALLASSEADPDQVRDGIALCRSAAERYHVLDDPSWQARPLAAMLPPADKARVREDLGEVLTLWGRALAARSGAPRGPGSADVLEEAADRLGRAEACYGRAAVPRALVLARADLARRSGRGEDEVNRLVAEANAIPLRTPRERLLALADRVDPGERRQVLTKFLETVEGGDLRDVDYVNWMILGNYHVTLGRFDDAVHAFGVAVAMAPRQVWPRHNRGLAYLEGLHDFSLALEDFDRVISMRPGWPPGYINRALAKLGMGDARGAVDDLTRYLSMKDPQTRAWFIRAQAKEKLGDREGARLDREEGMKRPPDDEISYVVRGLARLAKDPRGALADFDAALAINPRYIHALQGKASVLAENLGRTEAGLKVLDAAIALHPESVPALGGRAVLLARLGRRDAALRDARAALTLGDEALTVYQAACAFALTSKSNPADRPEAFRLLADAVRKDDSWLAVAPTDPDLAPIRDRPEFRELLRAFAVVRQARATR